MFIPYTASDVDNIYHTSIVNAYKDNMENEAYERKKYLGVYIPSEEREFYQSINVDYWKMWILNDIDWFQFQGIL